MQNDETVQLKILVGKDEKLAWQLRAKLEKTDVSKKIRELMTQWLGGTNMTNAQSEKLKEAEKLRKREIQEMLTYAVSWPVGRVREVFADEIDSGEFPMGVGFVDEAGNYFAEDMMLLDKTGKLNPLAGGGALNWTLTWEPAVVAGWKPSEDDKTQLTAERYAHVVAKLAERARAVGQKY